jgi:thymidylate kinase
MILEKFAPVLPPAVETDAPLSAAVRFIDALNQAGVRYCHWKSNLRLADGLAGRTDLDLLVDRQDEQAFRRILSEQGFKPLADAPGKSFPGLEHQLGFDWQTGRLIHLHVHFQLVLGEQYVKNYLLPLERQFLDSVRLVSGVKTPSPELELLVLALRALLKYRDRDGIKDILGIRSPGIPAHIMAELAWLQEQISPVGFEKTLTSVSEMIPAEAIREFLALIQTQPRDGWRLLRLRAAVRRELRRYQRRGRSAAAAAYFQALWRKSGRGERQMGLPGGGKRIALVGVDGSGKTTLSQALTAWLSWKIDSHLLYLGSKQPSKRSKALYWFFRIARRSQTEISRRWGSDHLLARLAGRVKQRLIAWHYLSIGADRYRRYRLGERLAAGGSVVVFDRFPFEAPLDGPEIGRIAAEDPRRLARAARREQELYARFQPVELLLLLDTPADVSMQRKPDHPEEVIEAKHEALTTLKESLEQPGSPWKWVAVDASRPMEEVLLAAKRAIWEAL